MLRLRLSISLVVLLSMLAPLLAPAVSARQAPNVSTPESAAVFYSQLEAAGSFSELYQWMHPDAKQLIPQAAVVGWYTNEFAPSGPGVITVTGVQMMAWTWEVTGTTYPNTAVVSFRQPFANGTVVEDVVRLVESHGEWRWFFGRSRAFVDEQIARYPSVPLASGDQCAGAAEWWAETFPRTFTPEYFAFVFPSLWAGGSGNGAIMQSYADLFATLHDEQALSSPPPAAATLHAELLSIFDTYETAASNLAAAQSGNMNPLAETGAMSAGLQGMDTGGSALLKLGTTIETFVEVCDPLVVFVYGMGEDLPIGVLPGDTTSIRPVQCSSFESTAHAQRFFEAAKPGDPHRLHPDNDGRACR